MQEGAVELFPGVFDDLSDLFFNLEERTRFSCKLHLVENMFD